jgi:ribosomal protein S25
LAEELKKRRAEKAGGAKQEKKEEEKKVEPASEVSLDPSESNFSRNSSEISPLFSFSL